MAAEKNAEKNDDTRSTKTLLTQWRKLEEIRRSLVRNGLLDGNATPGELVEALRKAIPVEVFGNERV